MDNVGGEGPLDLDLWRDIDIEPGSSLCLLGQDVRGEGTAPFLQNIYFHFQLEGTGTGSGPQLRNKNDKGILGFCGKWRDVGRR
jgi:hypothetical protein